MGKLIKILLLITISILGLYWWCCKCKNVIKVSPLPEDVWWGPGEPKPEDTSIRPFKINVPNEVLQDLNERLDKTRPLTPPLENIGFEYGFNTNVLKEILKFWRNEYKWREREQYLNQFPQFKTNIQGLDIHFIHIKPKTSATIKRSIPLLLLHGWPGSVREFYATIPYLTEKPLHGADFVFEIIVPSLPGYGFSQAASKVGLGSGQMAVIFKLLMQRLGFQTFYVQGGDWGSQIASHMALFYPQMVRGLHMNMCTASQMNIGKILLGALYPPLVVDKKDEHKLYPLTKTVKFYLQESGYFHIQATKPDTVGVGLTDSPAGLAAYILEKFSTATNPSYRKAQDGGLLNDFTYTDLLDNVMIYWITGSITTAVRLYAEDNIQANRDLKLQSAEVNVPTWCSKFENEIFWNPDSILRLRYPLLVRSIDHNFGGHFAAMELPKIFADDLWSTYIEAEQMKQQKKSKKNEL